METAYLQVAGFLFTFPYLCETARAATTLGGAGPAAGPPLVAQLCGLKLLELWARAQQRALELLPAEGEPREAWLRGGVAALVEPGPRGLDGVCGCSESGLESGGGGGALDLALTLLAPEVCASGPAVATALGFVASLASLARIRAAMEPEPRPELLRRLLAAELRPERPPAALDQGPNGGAACRAGAGRGEGRGEGDEAPWGGVPGALASLVNGLETLGSTRRGGAQLVALARAASWDLAAAQRASFRAALDSGVGADAAGLAQLADLPPAIVRCLAPVPAMRAKVASAGQIGEASPGEGGAATEEEADRGTPRL